MLCRVGAVFLLSAALFWTGPVAVSLAQGYSGVVAPAPDQPIKTTPTPGYQGVVPGAVPAQSSPKAPEQKISPAPGQTELSPPATPNDLADAAFMEAIKIDENNPPPELAALMTMPPGSEAVLARPRPRIEGMLPAEYTAKQKIDTVFKTVADKTLTPEARKQKIQAAYDTLAALTEDILSQNSVPDNVYKNMKAPEIYIKETREGNEKALERLGAALKTLKGMM